MLDTDLAAALGMARRTNVRAVIEANREELEVFGGLLAAQANPGTAGGRPGTAYHLNEEQALLICMLSRTERAKQVRAEVIRVFTAWRRGQIATVRPIVARHVPRGWPWRSPPLLAEPGYALAAVNVAPYSMPNGLP
ncbi:hypothetical protein [Bosea sp. (in: a-proteobacteria)]|uniref:hypothetical protein n=1 Tax=Bosea sp. (in: a-proteobacteria) TaxID=1871050 RepID=UPI002B47D378|nr:hypothetical protein [Bosea sp. (in: a-proteobacteria)]WRH56681.1 MAG: hypothetical protein RSE11_16765 [Bosea sp. (in: a-proteobacteria)]